MTDDPLPTPCEPCGAPDAYHLVDSDAGLWPTRVPMCDACYERYEDGGELVINVRKIR